MNIKNEIINIKKQIMITAILNQIQNALSDIKSEESKKIINAILNNKSAEIKVIIGKKTIAIYSFHK